MYAPRYTDTTAANLQKGIDSCSAIIYIYMTHTFWYRSCEGGVKHWVEISTGGSGDFSPFDTLFVGTLDTCFCWIGGVIDGQGLGDQCLADPCDSVTYSTGPPIFSIVEKDTSWWFTIGSLNPKASFDIVGHTDTTNRLMFYGDKGAFRVGYFSGTSLDVVGNYSVGIGYDNKATAVDALAIGKWNEVTNTSALAIGYNNRVNGINAITIGNSNTANDFFNIAIGEANHVDAPDVAFAIGFRDTVTGTGATAMGWYMNVTGNYSFGINLVEDPMAPENITLVQDHTMSIMGGQVGIGTLAPDNTFQVNGTLKFVTGNQQAGYVLTSDADGVADWAAPVAATVPISSLLAATGANSINNSTFTQTWNWDGLRTGEGLRLLGGASSNTTTGNIKILEVISQNVDISNGHSTYSIYASNTNLGGVLPGDATTAYAGFFSSTGSVLGGTTKTNIAAYFNASGATVNRAIEVNAGNVLLTPLTASTIMGIGSDKVLKSVALSGLTFDGTTLTVTGGSVTWNGITNPTGDQALTFDAGESSTWTNSNTTEDLFTVNTSTMTTSSLFSLNSTSTTLASGNNLMELVMSGANGSSGITATGMRISVTNTGTTSTNVGLSVTASGASTNTAIVATGGITSTANITATGNLIINGSGSMVGINNRANPSALVMTLYGPDANGINFFNSAGGVDVFRFKIDGELLVNTTTDNGAFNLQVNGAARIAGSITLPTAGNKLNITTGSNASVGQATLSGGTITVNTTAVTASSLIFLTYANCTNCQSIYISAIVASTSFTITATNPSDASTVNWWIIN